LFGSDVDAYGRLLSLSHFSEPAVNRFMPSSRD
jgi:hypothetical protein